MTITKACIHLAIKCIYSLSCSHQIHYYSKDDENCAENCIHLLNRYSHPMISPTYSPILCDSQGKNYMATT